MAGLSVAEIMGFIERSGPQITKKVKVKKEPHSMPSRVWGGDTVMSKFYICAVFDETESIAYLIGGLGTTERLVDSLVEHKLKAHDKKPYLVVSKGQKTSPGINLDLLAWEKVVVIPGTGDFHFLLRNHRGRKAIITR